MQMDLTPEEVELIKKYREEQTYRRGFDAGLCAAARLAENWGREAGGGSGQGGQGYLNLADSIRKIELKERA